MVSQMLTSDHRPLGCVVGVAALLFADPVPVFFSRSDMAQLWLTAWHC
jgi:hypothetical protein